LVWRKGLGVKYETANVCMNVISSSVLATIVPVEKQCVAYCEFVFIALVTQHAMRMRCITLLSLACLAVAYFFPFVSYMARISV